MSEITMDAELEKKLNGLDELVIVRNVSGDPVGVILPMSDYKKLLKDMVVPFSEEEIAERREIRDGMSLQEFWQTLDQS